MAILEDMFKGNIVTALVVGVGSALLAPVLVPAVSNLLRPAAKAVIKGGIVAYDKGREAMAQMTEATSDLTAEARADISSGEGGAKPAVAA